MDYVFIVDNRPLWAILISLFAAIIILFNDKRPNVRERVTLIAATGKVVIVFSMLPAVLTGHILETAPIDIVEGISLHFRADALGILFAALAAFLWVITSFYSIGYMRRIGGKHQTGFYAAFALCLSATMGIAFSANLSTFFIFYEMLMLSAYPLVVHKRHEDAIRAGRKYLAYALVSGQLFLMGIIWIYVLYDNTTFAAGGFMEGNTPIWVLRVIFTLLLCGTAVKSAIMPLHGWLPSAMVAPTPVSALLHAVAVVNAGVFAIIRIVGYVFGPELLSQIGAATVLAWLAAFTIIISSLIALSHDNLKKRLAYSTIGQLSYMVLGAALLTPLGFLGGIFYMVAHSFMKITLFFCAGAIYATNHLSNVSEMKGIGLKMPYTMAAFTVGALGISGLPFIVGFLGKWYIALGALQGGQWIFIAILIGSSLLSISYLMPIVYMAFFKSPAENCVDCQEAGLMMRVPLLLTAAFSLILGIFPDFGAQFYSLAFMAAENITGGGM